MATSPTNWDLLGGTPAPAIPRLTELRDRGVMAGGFTTAIEGVYRLEGGRTVLVGPVTHGSPFIRRVACELMVGDEVVQLVELEGEMLPAKRIPSDGRSVGTLDDVRLTEAQPRGAVCRLREVPGTDAGP